MAFKAKKKLKICPKCGVEFLTARATYCSRACGITAHYDQIGRKISKNFRGVCEVCGLAFQRTYFHNSGRTCGAKCAAILRVREGRSGRVYPAPRLVVAKGNYLREYAPDHPKRDKDNRVAQHRLVVERHIGRMLEDWEKVHHRNGVKTQNDIENLEIVTHARPNGVVICPHCRKSFQVH